jgi:hypothetical protein
MREREKTGYSEQRLKGLRTSTEARKQETVERLREAIAALKDKKQAISAQHIYAECGLHYASYARNPEALALFRANSTHLTQKRKRVRGKSKKESGAEPPQRDPLLNYKKPQLVNHLRIAMQRTQELERQQGSLQALVLEREARLVELEVKLAELEPYRGFVEQMRQRIRKEEHGSIQPPFE